MTPKNIFAAAAAVSTLGYASLGEAAICTLAFNNSASLSALTYSEQCLSFVTSTNPYKESCGATSSIQVIESFAPPPGRTQNKYGHHHLSWEDPTINCIIFDNPNDLCFGRNTQGGACVSVNHNTLPRYASSHIADQWIHLQRRNSFGVALQSSVTRIRIRSGSADVWIQKSDNSWLVYNNLGVGYWALNNGGSDIKNVLVQQDSGSAAFSFDDVRFEF